MNDAAEIIKTICAEYASEPLNDVEVCTWIRDRIYEQVKTKRENFTHTAIKFRGALIEFIQDSALFCVYMQGADKKILDISFPLTMYIQREYGITTTSALLSTINFGYSEAMDLAMQVTDEICIWVGLVEDVVLT